MTTTPIDSVNKPAAWLDGLVAALMRGETQLAETILHANVPETDWPVVKQLIDSWLENLSGAISIASQELVTTAVINVQAFGKNSAVLQNSLAYDAAKKSGDQDALTQAKKDFGSAMATAGHWGGISKPAP